MYYCVVFGRWVAFFAPESGPGQSQQNGVDGGAEGDEVVAHIRQNRAKTAQQLALVYSVLFDQLNIFGKFSQEILK